MRDSYRIERDTMLRFEGLRSALAEGRRVTVIDEGNGRRFQVRCVVTPRERDILLAGGLLARTAAEAKR